MPPPVPGPDPYVPPRAPIQAMEEARAQAGSADDMTRIQGEIALEFFEPLEASLKSGTS